MPWWVWIGLGVFAVSLLYGAIALLLGVRGLMQAARSLEARLSPVAASLGAATERLSRKNERLAADQAIATETIGRLRSSITQIRVLVDALHEVRFVLRLVRLVRAVR
jgi:hypothetical protein